MLGEYYKSAALLKKIPREMETVCGFAVKETLSGNQPRAFSSCGLKKDVHTHGKESAIKIGKKSIAVRN